MKNSWYSDDEEGWCYYCILHSVMPERRRERLLCPLITMMMPGKRRYDQWLEKIWLFCDCCLMTFYSGTIEENHSVIPLRLCSGQNDAGRKWRGGPVVIHSRGRCSAWEDWERFVILWRSWMSRDILPLRGEAFLKRNGGCTCVWMSIDVLGEVHIWLPLHCLFSFIGVLMPFWGIWFPVFGDEGYEDIRLVPILWWGEKMGYRWLTMKYERREVLFCWGWCVSWSGGERGEVMPFRRV